MERGQVEAVLSDFPGMGSFHYPCGRKEVVLGGADKLSAPQEELQSPRAPFPQTLWVQVNPWRLWETHLSGPHIDRYIHPPNKASHLELPGEQMEVPISDP